MPFALSYKNTKFLVILKIENFCHLLSTLIAIKCFNFFHFSDTFFLHTFLLTKNVIPCDKDVNKNYMKHSQSFHLFRHKRKLMWLGDELGRRISKFISFISDEYHCPNHRRRWRLGDKPSIVPTKFISGDEGGRWSSSPRWEPSLKWLKRLI